MYADVTESLATRWYFERSCSAPAMLEPDTFVSVRQPVETSSPLRPTCCRREPPASSSNFETERSRYRRSRRPTCVFLESHRNAVDVIDHAPTNFNGFEGSSRLRNHPRQFGDDSRRRPRRASAFREHYDVGVLLRHLVHLKNPYAIMESLGRASPTLFLSTKVTRFARLLRAADRSLPVAYLLDRPKANRRPTNFLGVSQTAGLADVGSTYGLGRT